MNLQQLSEGIASKIGLPDAATTALIKSWLGRRYLLIWQKALWRDALTLYTIAVEAGTTNLVLADEAECAMSAAWDKSGLLPGGLSLAFTKHAQSLLDAGTPTEFADVGRLGMPGDPDGGQLRLVSSSASDTAVTVTVLGELAGVEVREIVTLDGTSAVTTTSAFDLVRALSKTVSLGTISVKRESDNAALATLGSLDVERQHVQMRLLPPAQNAGTLLVLAKRRCHALRNNSDVPVLRTVSLALEAFAHADALEWMRQYAKAQSKFAEAVSLLEQAEMSDVWQPAHIEQIVPTDGVGTCNPFC